MIEIPELSKISCQRFGEFKNKRLTDINMMFSESKLIYSLSQDEEKIFVNSTVLQR